MSRGIALINCAHSDTAIYVHRHRIGIIHNFVPFAVTFIYGYACIVCTYVYPDRHMKLTTLQRRCGECKPQIEMFIYNMQTQTATYSLPFHGNVIGCW